LGFILYAWQGRVKKISVYDGNGVQAVENYKNEFADLLKIGSTNWTIKTYGEANIYFSGPGGEPVPNGKFTLHLDRISNGILTSAGDYYRLTIVDDVGRKKDIITIEEADAGSGLSFQSNWSEDLKAVFIYGRGKPYGYDEYWKPISLIYLVEENKIYTIDLKEILFNRMTQTNLSGEKPK